jgi:hypothetical protein
LNILPNAVSTNHMPIRTGRKVERNFKGKG